MSATHDSTTSPMDTAVLRSLCLLSALICGGLVIGACGSTAPVESSTAPPDTAGAARTTNSEPTAQEIRDQYSIYYEAYRNEDFSSARKNLGWILENAPGFPEDDDRNYRRAVKLYEELASSAGGEAAQTAYLDTAASYLARAPKQMEKLEIPFEPYKWEIRRGRFADRHEGSFTAIPALERPTTHYRRAFRAAPEKVNAYYIRRVLKTYLEADTLEGALEFADTVSNARGDNSKIAAMTNLLREKVFAGNPQAKIARLETQVEQHPDSSRLLTELFNAYSDTGNRSKASSLADRLMEHRPPAETIRKIAEMRLKDGQYEAALVAYDRAEEEGAELEYRDYFNRGTAYQKSGRLARARRQYRNVLNSNASFGRAYVAIGDLYTLAVNRCSGSAMARQDRAVYWAAADKYEKAKSIDSSVADLASHRLSTYTEVFPTQEDIFYRSGWEPGASFTIDYGCYAWIGETTTVRPAPSPN